MSNEHEGRSTSGRRRGFRRTRRRHGAHRRGRSSRGAVLLEFALVAPMLFALIFGIVDFGFAYNDWISVRQGSREGARQAVVATFGTDDACEIKLTEEINLDTTHLICLTKERVGLDEPDTRVKVLLGVGGYGVGESLTICVQYPVKSISGFFSSLLDGKVVESEVTMRIEEVLAPGLVNAQEPALPGNDWKFCQVPLS